MLNTRYYLSDFVDIQRKSFFELLQNGLIDEFSKRNPITSKKKDVEVYFYAEYYKLTLPNYTPGQAILRCKSYTSKLYMPVQLTFKKSNIIRLKWAYVGNLPLMTKRGHFILNGAPRIIVNQIIRSPGIYYQEKLYERFTDKLNEKPNIVYKRYYADLICLRGTWLRLEIDRDKDIWAQTKKGPKIPIFWFLIGMGLSEHIILNSMLEPERVLQNLQPFTIDRKSTRKKRNDYLYVKNPPAAWSEIYSEIILKKSSASGGRSKSQAESSELGRKWLFNKFMNPRSYDLSKQGRSAFNKKLGLKIDANQLTLTPQDLLSATNYLLKVEKGLKNLDDIDHLKNRRVRTSGELIQIQIGIAVVRLEKTIREKLNKKEMQFSFGGKKSTNIQDQFKNDLSFPGSSEITQKNQTQDDQSIKNKKNERHPVPVNKLLIKDGTTKKAKSFTSHYYETRALTITSLIQNKSFNSALREFFGTSPLSQFMDQINPLAEITHKRRLSSMGPGGVTRDTATLEIRGIHPTHYGRICPVETPEGKNTGLVNSLTSYSRVNPLGILESPFYKVYKGMVLKNLGLFFLSAEQEEKVKLAAADIFVTPLGFLPNTNIPVRIGEKFTKIHRKKVEYVGVSATQMISIATSLIPFLEHDDANRALMGSNMQRQAVPLIRPERPIVGTGLEPRAVSDSGHVIQAKFSGVITYVSAEKIIVKTLKKNYTI
jgi:DNA-directed RNA polymerase subunit beta